ncbi:hypothetical protein LCGC14_2265920 [marine sediment metagenome]|uniref:Uncharacterized protein n=1 Tax=marine sediment metagenome TaxID=412755 RepID=A0A0F9FTE7_9ZZZZ
MAESAWRWPIMLTIDPDPKYAEVMEDVVVLLVPERDEKSRERPEEPRVLTWQELDFDDAMEWLLENAFVPADLTSAIEQLKAKQRELKAKVEHDT